MKHILFNIASRSRPQKCEELILSIYHKCGDPKGYTVLLKTDADDPTAHRYMAVGGSFLLRTHSENKIHAINRDIPSKGWDIIVDLSDDFVITRKGFDNIIREHCGTDDCLHFPEPFATKQNINNRNDNIIIMACMGREYYNRFGYIFNPEYKSLWVDNELTDVAKITGRYKFVDEDIFYHAHPAAGYGKADAQTKHTESFWNEDKATYLKRKAMNFGL